MDEIICPNCGKPNSEELKFCRFCHAALPGGQGGEALPDWMRDLGSPDSEFNAPASPESGALAGEVPAEAGEALPDWLKSPQGNTFSLEEPAQAAPSPDWLGEPPKESSLPVVSPFTDDSDLPEWLGELNPVEPLSFMPPEPGQPVPAASLPPAQPPAEGAEGAESDEGPEWLVNLLADDKPAAAPSPAPGAELPSLPGAEEGKPDWMAELSALEAKQAPAISTPPEPTGAEQSSPRALETLPEWVDDLSEAQGEKAASPAEPELEPAELPLWLEAMRPAEAATLTPPPQDFSGEAVVSAGPLIGLRGVLSVEPAAARPRKPAAYSVKLSVTDEQRARVTLLKELLDGEQTPRPVPARPVITPQYIFRLAVALALILPVVWLLYSQAAATPLPQPGSDPAVVDFSQVIRSVPTGAPVLVAFDYEAGFSGELEGAVTAVLRHLLDKNAFLTLASTSPSGPALAQSFVNELTGSASPSGLSANLGYIPGGSLGLAGLSQALRQSLPYGLDGANVWAVPPLNAVNSLTDFSLLLVLTDNPETARAWIEQVGPRLQAQSVPLLMVTSAQAEPVIRPYYAQTGRQVQGLVAGLAGGADYEAVTGFPGQTRNTWDAFSASVLISALTLLVGGTAGMVKRVLAETRRQEK